MSITVLGAYAAAHADKTPNANSVVAGWVGFGVFMFLLVAVALLGWSMSRHLKKVRENEEKGGVYDPSDKKPRRTRI